MHELHAIYKGATPFTVIIFRYLAREVLVSMLAISTALLIIFISARFVKYLGQAASGDMTTSILFAITLYRMPGFMELILPLGFFLGILLAYGRLYAESEMIVLLACGVGKLRLLAYTMVPALLMMLIVGLLSLKITPLGMTKFQELWQDPKNFSGVGVMVPGRFQAEEGKKLVTYAEGITQDRSRMHNVFLAGEGDRQLMVVMVAESGRVYTDTRSGARFIELTNGYRYEGNPGVLDYRITRFETFGQLLREQGTDFTVTKVDALPTSVLRDSADPAHQAALQWRWSLPITVPIIALIALSLSETNHRRGRFVKLPVAIIVYLVYLVLLIAVRSGLEDGHLAVAGGMWWVHLLFLVLGLYLLFWGDWRRLRLSRRGV